MIGKTLGHYQITSQLGKGGMGEVYQAKDQKLGRDVAIKVLPEEFARDADRVARFQREAKLLASLNHPSIAAIYGLEESAGTNFLVLELVEGETLADRIKTGPIPVEESLKLALQIAEALEAAHEKGIIHRDLKPANIKVTPDGKVKVLDFGLAKAFAGEQADLNLSNSPTLSNAATQQGVILGTAAYMSPEQARGKAVDKRADIWAFGCVLYEMLTGKQTWTGTTVTDIIAAALAKEPDFGSVPPNIHSDIRKLLNRCLQKDPAERFRDVGDVRVEIKHILADPAGLFIQPIATAKPRKKLRLELSWVAAIVVLSIIATGIAVWQLKPTDPRQVTRFYHELAKDQQFGDVSERAIAVSPDGQQFVYSTSEGLYLRSMEDIDARLLTGTAGNLQRPFFSPDGKWIGFFSSTDRKLKKIAISGGAPVTLADVTVAGSFSWNTDDTIVYGQWGRGIMRVSANGGTPEQIIKPAENETILHPQVLPDGKSILFARVFPRPFKIMVQSLKTGERKELLEGSVAKYLPTGHIVYEFGSTLFGLRFDLNALKMIGGPVSLVAGVLRAGGAPQYAVSDSGTLVYIPGTTTAGIPNMRTLVWVDRNGKEEPVGVDSRGHTTARISPDGTKVALQFGTDGNYDIWVEDLLRKTMTRLTFDPARDFLPLWTPDGKRIAFASGREGSVKIFWKAADNTGKEELLGTLPGGDMLPASWSRDGKTLIVIERANQSVLRSEIGMLSMGGDHKHRVLLKEKYTHLQPQLSTNGRWIAYTSDESGRPEIYVRPCPDVDTGHWQVSTSGGDSPLWSHDGRELFYHNADAIMAVPVKTETTFSLGTPKILFQGTYVFPNISAIAQSLDVLYPWDISADGKRFLMIKPPGTATSAEGGPRKINIVLNWFEELNQRVPVK